MKNETEMSKMELDIPILMAYAKITISGEKTPC